MTPSVAYRSPTNSGFKVDPRLLALRAHSAQRLESLRSQRISWWAYWAELAAMYLPHRYRYFTTPNNASRGSPKNGQILDETGLIAARTLATGLLAGLTSPTKPWFRLGIHGITADLPEGPEKQYLADCTRVLLEIYSGSNFYESLGQAYYDMAVFGTSNIIQYDDFDNIVRFYVAPLGEFFLGVSNKLIVDTFYREYTYTVRQCVQEFGFENCSINVQTLSKSASSLDTEVVIAHAIEPNVSLYNGLEKFSPPVSPSMFPWRETYWEQTAAGGQKSGHILKVAGFREQPFVGLRWDVTANDPYGRGPGMYALPAVLQLQVEQKRKGEAIDKQVRPPMVGSISMKNEPSSILPGGITYVADPAAAGFKPAFQVTPNIAEMKEDIAENQQRVRTIFFNNLFTGITDLDTVRTATEIEARKQEIAILVGPVIERTENEGLDKLIMRTYAIAQRKGLLPPMPETLKNRTVSIRYISLLAEAQRAAATAGVERLLAILGNMSALKPEVADNLDFDETFLKYGDMLDVDPELFHTPAQVIQFRQARAEAQQQQAALQVGSAAAQGAQTLSQTNVGGGQNALQMMMGRAA